MRDAAAQGVVVVEDLLKINTLLRVADQDNAVLMQSLEQLSQKIPSRDLLRSTKIGHAVKRLSKHSDEKVSNLAKEIFTKWKTHFETKLCLPVVDVQCDRKTESLRQTARKHLTAALSTDKSTSSEVASNLAKDIEFQVFHEHRRIINGEYQRCMRRMVLALQQRETLRQSVIEGQLTVIQLVSDFKT